MVGMEWWVFFLNLQSHGPTFSVQVLKKIYVSNKRRVHDKYNNNNICKCVGFGWHR